MTRQMHITTDESSNDRTVFFCKLSIAGLHIEIESYNKRVLYQFKDYLARFNQPDIIIQAEDPDSYTDADNIAASEQVYGIATEYIGKEFLEILRKLADELLVRRTLLFHGAAIEIDNKCYIFTAPSGTGKTTHIMNWVKMIPGTIVLNGDKPFVNVDNLLVYGTPWCGKEGLNMNKSSHLAGIIELHRGETNSISSISFKDILPVLLQQIYIPSEPNLSIRAYHLIGKLSDVPCYRLFCNMEEESACVAYRGIIGE